jgi:hypothetical protein
VFLALPASNVLDDGIVRSGTDGDRLLDQAVEELPSVLRGASIEAKGEFVQIGVEVLTTDGPLVRAQQPALQKGRDTMNPAEEESRLPLYCVKLPPFFGQVVTPRLW